MDFQSAKSFRKLRPRAFQPYHQYYICWHCRYKTRISNAFNAIYVDTVDTKHIHTFLPITFLIFNGFSIRKKVLESRDPGLFNHTINTIYVDTVDTRQGSLMHSMLSMSTLLIQFLHLIVLCIRCCVRATVSTVSTNIALNALCALIFISTVSTKKIPYSIHNSIAFDLLYRSSGHAFMSIQTTMQILIQSLRITVKFDLNPWFTLNYNRVRIKTLN